jgi:hypothetical protein
MIERVEKVLAPIVDQFVTGEYHAQVVQAKAEYFERTGIVYEDDSEFEQRMNLFMDWYLLDRDLPGVDLPPLRFYSRSNALELGSEDQEIIEGLCNTIHSLFVLKRLTVFQKKLVIQDLFSKKSYTVDEDRLRAAFAPGDLFEARIIPIEGKYSFANGFCFHPREVLPFVKAEIAKIRHQDRARHIKFILQLAGMKLKHQRFAHIPVRHIYAESSRF